MPPVSLRVLLRAPICRAQTASHGMDVRVRACIEATPRRAPRDPLPLVCCDAVLGCEYSVATSIRRRSRSAAVRTHPCGAALATPVPRGGRNFLQNPKGRRTCDWAIGGARLRSRSFRRWAGQGRAGQDRIAIPVCDRSAHVRAAYASRGLHVDRGRDSEA